MENKFYVMVGATAIVFIILGVIAYTIEYTTLSGFLIRVFTLWGYTSLSIATISTPFVPQIRKRLGVVFLKLHHTYAAFGLAFISLHPVAAAIRSSSLLVFLPSFESWIVFWSLAGRPALIIIYVATLGFYLRRRIRHHWRQVHALMYVALLFGVVHGNLIGTDFNNVIIWTFFNLLFLASAASFVYKRFQIKKGVNRFSFLHGC